MTQTKDVNDDFKEELCLLNLSLGEDIMISSLVAHVALSIISDEYLITICMSYGENITKYMRFTKKVM